MKSYNIIFSLLFVSSSLFAGRITNAIEKLHVSSVRSLLHGKELSKKRKKKYLKIVNHIIEVRRSDTTKNLLTSFPDLCRMFIGLGFFGGGLVGAGVGAATAITAFATDNEGVAGVAGVGTTAALITAILGAREAGKGWNLHSVHCRLEKAHEIKKIILHHCDAECCEDDCE